MSRLEADRAVVDTCSPSRIYAWVCINLMHKELGISPSFIILPRFPALDCGVMLKWFGKRAEAIGSSMPRYHVYNKSSGNPDCLEYSRFIHQHMYHVPNFDCSSRLIQLYPAIYSNSKAHFYFLRPDIKPSYNPRILFISTHCY